MNKRITFHFLEDILKAIASMRDRLTHHYWDTKVEILWKTIKESLPPFKIHWEEKT